MPRNRFGVFRINQPVLTDHIRRITGNNIKGSSVKKTSCLLDISCHNRNFIFQSVQRNAPPRHIGAFLLDFQARQVCRFCPGLHQNREYPRTGSHIQNGTSFFRDGKSGEQHRIHSEAEPVRILDDPVSVTLQIVYSFVFFQHNISFNYHPVSKCCPPASPVPSSLPHSLSPCGSCDAFS